jgi:hypothetical protein
LVVVIDLSTALWAAVAGTRPGEHAKDLVAADRGGRAVQWKGDALRCMRQL